MIESSTTDIILGSLTACFSWCGYGKECWQPKTWIPQSETYFGRTLTWKTNLIWFGYSTGAKTDLLLSWTLFTGQFNNSPKIMSLNLCFSRWQILWNLNSVHGFAFASMNFLSWYTSVYLKKLWLQLNLRPWLYSLSRINQFRNTEY